MIDNLWAATTKLEQRFGMNWVNLLPVMHIPLFWIAIITTHKFHTSRDFGPLCIHNQKRILSVVALKIAMPGCNMDVIALATAWQHCAPPVRALRELFEPPQVLWCL